MIDESEYTWEVIGRRKTIGLTIQNVDAYSVLVKEDLSDIDSIEMYDNLSREILSTENGSIIYFNKRIDRDLSMYKTIYVDIIAKKYKPTFMPFSTLTPGILRPLTQNKINNMKHGKQ